MGPSSRRYVVTVLLASAALLGMVYALTFAVDPYAIHGRARIEGFNAKKPSAYTHAARAKRALAAAAHPSTLLLGNSRIDAGFDPASAAIPARARPAFNFGLPGQSLSGDFRNLISTAGLDGVHRAVIGLDYPDFILSPSEPRPERPQPAPPAGLLALARTNLSLTALVDAGLTIWRQRGRFTNSMTPLGANTFAEYAGHARVDGYHGLFHQKNVEYLRRFLHRDAVVESPTGQRSASFAYLDWLLEWCRERGVEVDPIIYPYHAHLLETLHLTGHWQGLEQWKRLLVRRLSGEDASRVRLWDFSGYHGPASEPVPARGDTTTTMRWFWESGHFKSALGDRVLAQVFDRPDAPTMGARLDPGSVEQVLGAIRAGRARWRSARPAEADYLDALHARLTAER